MKFKSLEDYDKFLTMAKGNPAFDPKESPIIKKNGLFTRDIELSNRRYKN